MYGLVQNAVIALSSVVSVSAVATNVLITPSPAPIMLAVYTATTTAVAFLVLSVVRKREGRGGAEGEI